MFTLSSFKRYRLRAIALAMTLAMSSCGGGGGEGNPPAPDSAATAARAVEQSDLEIAQGVYGSGSRTPADFYTDAAVPGQSHVSTAHLKNTDLDASLAAPHPQYELCTNDWNQAMDWSESSAQDAPQYANLVATNDDARYFEFDRVRTGEPQFYLRTRVFKCTYLDRATADLRTAVGSAGQLNRRPLTAADLRTLSEYLWQFTSYNNFGHVVLKSSGTTTGTAVTHTLIMGKLVRNGLSAGCDRIDVIAWRHTADASSGALDLGIQTLWSFGARESGGAAQLCAG